MKTKQFVAYYRVSTQKQGNSGLGLEAQKQTVSNYLNEGNYELLAAYTEIETGKGANALDKRPQLRNALNMCRKNEATLIIAKLDRLARNVHFISGLIESGCDFIASDMPHANKVMLQMHAVMSEWERDQISIRTKLALQAAKIRGQILGKCGADNLKSNLNQRQKAAKEFSEKLKGQLEGYKLRGLTQRQMIADLNLVGIRALKGGEWSLNQLQRVMNKNN